MCILEMVSPMIERSIVTPYTTGRTDKQKRSEGFRISVVLFAHACTHLRNLSEYGRLVSLFARKWRVSCSGVRRED